jgi:lipopolysaccharide heptosyltransferase II
MTSDGAGSALSSAEVRPLDWSRVRRVLVVRLRSIGDTVLATPALGALRRFLPEARIDLLLEDWIAPLLYGHRDIDNVVAIRRSSLASRVRTLLRLRRARYDVAFNLHGGTTATLLTRLSGARQRVGYAHYRFGSLHSHAMPSAARFFRRDEVHSVEEQIALLGWAGVHLDERPATRLDVDPRAQSMIEARLRQRGLAESAPLGLIHPATAFETKRWPAEGYARVAEHLSRRGLAVIAIAAPQERPTLDELQREAGVAIQAFSDLSLPEVAALIARSRVFVGNDSGIAHMAAALRSHTVVVFGSSNIAHWRPWAEAPAAVVRHEMPCQPCPGYTCAGPEPFGCLRRIDAESVIQAIDRVL